MSDVSTLLVVVELEIVEEHSERLPWPPGTFFARPSFRDCPLSDALCGLEASTAGLQVLRRAAFQCHEAAVEDLVLHRRLGEPSARGLSSLCSCTEGGCKLRWIVPHADVTRVVRDLGDDHHHESVELTRVRDEVHAIEASEVVQQEEQAGVNLVVAGLLRTGRCQRSTC